MCLAVFSELSGEASKREPTTEPSSKGYNREVGRKSGQKLSNKSMYYFYALTNPKVESPDPRAKYSANNDEEAMLRSEINKA